MAPDGIDALGLLTSQASMFAAIRDNYRPPLALTDSEMDDAVTAPYLDTEGPSVPGRG